MNLRKRLIERSLSQKPSRFSPAHRPSARSHDPLTARDDVVRIRVGGVDSVDGDMRESVQSDSVVVELRRKVRECEQRCEAERKQTELVRRERDTVKGQLLQAQKQVNVQNIFYCIRVRCSRMHPN